MPIVPKSKTTNRAVKLSTGLPKKKTIKKNITAMSILTPKKKPTMKSKNALASALAPKSKERVIDKAKLKAQYSGNNVNSKSEEKDSKGSGIASLKKFGVVKKLEEACLTGTAKSKEGSLFAIELLSSQLGLLFEPYVIVLLPALLQSFSDTNNNG